MAFYSKESPLKVFFKIRDFSRLGFYGNSDYFECDLHLFGFPLNIFFYPRVNGNCCCFLSLQTKRKLNVNYGFLLKDNDGTNLRSDWFTHNGESSRTSEWKEFISYEDILKNKNKYLLHDSLTVCIMICGTLSSNSHFEKHSSSIKEIHCYSILDAEYKSSLAWTIHGLKVDVIYENIVYFENNCLCSLKLTCTEDDECKVVVERPIDNFLLKSKISVFSQPSDFSEVVTVEYLENAINKKLEIPAFRIGNKTTIKCYRNFHFRFKFHLITRTFHCEYVLDDKNTNECLGNPGISQDFLKMFKEQQMTDITLRVEDETILAHKFVLASRSPAFKRLLETAQLESNNVIEIKFMSMEILKEFLLVLYGAKPKDLNVKKAAQLLFVAKQYRFFPLRQHCSEFLRTHMSEINFCNILSLSDALNEHYLKIEAIEFFKDNSKSLLSSSDWDNWAKCNSKLALEVLTAYAKDK